MITEDIIEGMLIVTKYDKPRQHGVWAEHDQIYCGSFDLPVSDEDRTRLSELGWKEEDGVWSCWV